MLKLRSSAICALILALAVPLAAHGAKDKAKPKDDKKDDAGKMKSRTFSGLALRGIGPAMISGRITDIAVHPRNESIRYVASASGGLWKTTNAGTTWSPIFDGEASYSIGCITIDERNPLTVWVGSGENNSQRSVSYGDGVYKSLDGGTTWENVGLKASEHISKILVDPRDSNVVWVASQGPLWSPGGDRGLYVTRDGGKTWTKSLEISENTGVTDVVMDPRNPDVMLASAYQRRRHVWTLINGGPESAIHKTVDGGKTWKKLTNGLPKNDVGRIGLAISPVNPDTIYAVMDAQGDESGFYRSVDAGGNWEKRSSYVPTSPQYYNEIIADPKVEGRVYAMDTWMNVTDDAGKTFRRAGETYKHVDNHALWIDPADNAHMLSGCDGGLYETWDRAATWAWTPNLPLAQFYKVALDNAVPFYSVYGGTQDNNTLGGPSRTRTKHGIVNSDWFFTLEGDGFQTAVDPEDPNVVYSQAQHGALVRFDRKTGEAVDIQPQPEAGEAGSRWNWDSPLIISPHTHTRLYFASQRLYRSDDRGNTWRALGPDLTRQIDRNQLKVMGRVWSVDAISKNASTSFYGNIVALAESEKREGLLAVGTDDGLIQISEDGGGSWRKIESFTGVPERSYVSRVVFSRHDASTVYATFDNHKMGDFKPYVLESRDLGKSWTSIAGDLPQRGTVYALVQDKVKKDLLFAGTEFGVSFTADGGKHWIKLDGGMPTIQVRDLAIQEREGDLVAATFGRGFYILDDYTPLRTVTETELQKDALLFSVRRAWVFAPWSPFGGREKGFMGDSFYNAPNPPEGAVFTYYLKDEIKTRQKVRQAAEREREKKNEDNPYPTWDDLRQEDREEKPAVVFTVTDEDGGIVRRVEGPVKAGFARVAWDLRYPPSSPTSLTAPELDPWENPPVGPLAAPGKYSVSLAKRVEGKLVPLAGPVSFDIAPLGGDTLPPPDRAKLLAFQQKTGRLQRAVLGAARAMDEAQARIDNLKVALRDTPKADARLHDDVRAIEARLKDLRTQLSGDSTVSRRNEPVPPSILGRVDQVVSGHWYATADATATHVRNYEIAAKEFAPVLSGLRTLMLTDLTRLENAADAAGAPWTPGRVPDWKPE